MIRHRFQERVHQRHVDHRGLVDDEQVAFQRVILLAPEAAVYGIGFQEPMDRLRLTAGALRQLRRAAGDDQHLRRQRQLHRLALAGREIDAGLALDPWHGLGCIDRRPGKSANAQRLDPRRDRPFGAMQTGEEDAGLAIDGVGDDLAVSQLQIERRTPCVRSLTHRPLACTNSPAEIVAAWPTTVIRSRRPRAFTRRTQKPLSSLWKVTRSTRPARFSRSGGPGDPPARECFTTADQTRGFGGMKIGCLLRRCRIMTRACGKP
jgi:hypothetical protein